MILNGCKLDEDGNIIRTKKLRNPKQENPYSKVKSRYMENLDSFCVDKRSRSKSTKGVGFIEEGQELVEENKETKQNAEKIVVQNGVQNNIRDRIKAKRGRFNTEDDNSYMTSLINQCNILC